MTTTGGPGGGGAIRHEVEGPRVTDALYQAFPNTPTMMGTSPVDGLPAPANSQAWQDAQAPELNVEHFVCMADCSKFVRRDDLGRVTAEYTPDQVERMPSGRWYERHQGVGRGLAVEPIRQQCTHYARQLVPFPEDQEHRLVARLCTARRTDEGEFLDLGNAKMFACELRTPTIGNQQVLLDEFDERVIASQKKKVVADDFDVDAALGTQTTKG